MRLLLTQVVCSVFFCPNPTAATTAAIAGGPTPSSYEVYVTAVSGRTYEPGGHRKETDTTAFYHGLSGLQIDVQIEP